MPIPKTFFPLDSGPVFPLIEKCEEQPCLYICPANVYRMETDRISLNCEDCLECGSCRVGRPHFNIGWPFPRGGFGVRHNFG